MSARLAVLSRPAFRNLWIAQTASVIGDRVVLVALALYVTELTGSATDVGIVLAANTLPLVLLLLVGGVWADRLPRARLMIATDVVRAGLHGVLALLIFTDAVELWHLVVVEALFGAAEAFFRPAFVGLLPRTVPDHENQPAQALSNLSNNIAELAGPALATALVLGVGAGWAFLLDALTFVVSAVFLTRVRVPHTAVPPGERRTLLAELAEGFAHVRTRTWLWVTVAVFTLLVPLGYAPLFVLGPTVARDTYDWPALFGIVTTLIGCGALLGAIVGLRWRPRRPMLVGWLAMIPWAVLLVVYGAGVPPAVLLPLAVAMGAGFALFDVLWNTAMAERVPPHALSRVSSYDWMGSLALLPVGFLLAGPIAEATSTEAVMVGGGVLTAALVGVGLLPRQTRTLGRAVAEPAAPAGAPAAASHPGDPS